MASELSGAPHEPVSAHRLVPTVCYKFIYTILYRAGVVHAGSTGLQVPSLAMSVSFRVNLLPELVLEHHNEATEQLQEVGAVHLPVK